MLRTHCALLAACVLVACGSDSVEPSPEPEAEPTVEAAAEPAVEAAAEPTAAGAGFDGAWVVRTYTGKAAWLIEGDRLTTFESGAEASFSLAVVDDCTLSAADGAGTTTYTKYAWDGDTLYAGPGNSGIVRPDGSARACISNVAFEWSDGACERHKKSMFGDKWETEPAECTFADGVFEAKGSKLEVVGSALLDTQMKGNKAEREASFDEAKATL